MWECIVSQTYKYCVSFVRVGASISLLYVLGNHWCHCAKTTSTIRVGIEHMLLVPCLATMFSLVGIVWPATVHQSWCVYLLIATASW